MHDYQPDIVGIIGAGHFGTTLANLIASNCDVLVYSRDTSTVNHTNSAQAVLGLTLPDNVKATSSREELCQSCKVIIPVVPSSSFRTMIRTFAPILYPFHVLIHGTKGFDLDVGRKDSATMTKRKPTIKTMSAVIAEETQVVRIGCISGPNLSAEIRRGLPAATVVASEFDEVINIGYRVLSRPGFKIYGSHDLLGTEIAGALKNMIAMGTGMIAGLALGKNVQSLFITRGLREMLILGGELGADARTFLGTAGLGDLIATASSADSRNFNFGVSIAQGKTREEIERESDDLIEGIRTLKLMHQFAIQKRLDLPIIEMLYAVIFGGLQLRLAISYLLDYPYAVDVDFL